MHKKDTELLLFLVDDHPLYRFGTKALLQESATIKIAEFDCISGALTELNTQRPDVIFLDLELPDGSGLTSAKLFLDHPCQPMVVMLTTHKDAPYIEYAQKIGLQGFLFKDDDPKSLLDCLQNLSRDSFYMSDQVAVVLANNNDDIYAVSNSIEDLSMREQQVLFFLSNDLTSKEIAKHLGLSFRTVQNYRANIKEKYYFKRNSQLLKFAEKNKKYLTKLFG